MIHGDKLGSKLGYPTANISIGDKDKLIPKEGVYAVKIDIEGESFNGMMYIGKRPTLSGQDHNSVEVHIFDFNQNIYDQILKIEVMEYMREDRKFADLSELTAQLNVDEKSRSACFLHKISLQARLNRR
ncbi:MAG: riboflavin kinase [Saprospiraceae bacterium]|nr:riboflavin kinase [Saprospiraceae bacterium]